MKYGFFNVASAVPKVRVADVPFNIHEIISLVQQADYDHDEIIVFPELSVTGYTCQDLFLQSTLLKAAERGVSEILEKTKTLDIIGIIGAPVPVGNLLTNSAIVFQHGKILGIIPKTYLPNYNEFYEKRWFTSAVDITSTTIIYAGCQSVIDSERHLFVTSSGVKFGIEICEDVWAPLPCSNSLTLAGAEIIFNLSASDELIGKHTYLRSLLAQQSARTICGYVYSSCGYGESTQDLVYGGNALIYENGRCLARSDRFSFQPQIVSASIDIELLRSERRRNTSFTFAQRNVCASMSKADKTDEKKFVFKRFVNPHPFIPSADNMSDSCEEIFNIQMAGLAKRLVHTNSSHVVIGISGGLDSTLALLVCVKTFDKLGYDRKGIIGVTMPGFGTTNRTYTNAMALMNSLGVSVREINICPSVIQHFKDIQHDVNIHDVTYENSQARERTQILMDLSNQIGGLVIGTGDLSELALGWATYNGDHMSMYGVNASIPKTLIKYLVKYVAQNGLDKQSSATLDDILATPISPELIPADDNGEISQRTEDLVGPYELHDFFLFYFLRYGFSLQKIYFLAKQSFTGIYDDKILMKWLTNFVRRFFSQQFKRSCLPDGPKVGSVTLSPRGDWRMPSDANSTVWINECNNL